MEECNLTHEALSERVGKDRSTVTNYVRLLKLPPQIQSSIKTGKLSMGHARSLAGIEDVATQLKIYKQCIENQLSVRALENAIRAYQHPDKQNNAIRPTQSPEIIGLIDEISNVLGTKVQIVRNQDGKGQIVIPFKTDKELNQIINILKEQEV